MQSGRNGAESAWAYAPYNFVPFPEKRMVRYEDFEQLPKHDEAGPGTDGLLSGEVTFRIVARTPILVAEGNKKQGDKGKESRNPKFNKDVDSRYEIPGSTLRGLIRSAVGIIGHSDLRDGVASKEQREYTLMYRGLADAKIKGLNARKEAYEQIVSKKTVQAGYIHKTGKDSYEIIPAQIISGRTFTFVREQRLYKEGVLPDDGINAMYTREILDIEKIGRPKAPKDKMGPPSVENTEKIVDKQAYLHRYEKRLTDYHNRLRESVDQKDNPEKQNELIKEYNDLYRMFYSYLNACHSSDYKPYFSRRTVYITGNGEYFFQPGRGKRYDCYLMSSGYIQKKQSHYLIHPPARDSATITLSEKEVHWYRYDQKVKGNRLKFKEYYKLPERKGELKPCFYVTEGGFTYFGFTPYLRVYYRNTIGAGLPDYPEGGYDYVQAMFGFAGTKDRVGYAGRLNFRSAVMEGDSNAVQVRMEEVVAGQPMMTAVAMYIKQDNPNDLKTLNDKYEWRGIKQYWLKSDFERPEKNSNDSQNNNKKVKTVLHLLPKGTVFSTSIRFERLHEDELGLLLAALTWPKHQTIGMGKPYGAGCVTFEDIRLYLDNVTYRLDQFFADEPKEVPRERFDEYILKFCKQMKSICDDVKQSTPVRIYLAMREKVYDHIKKQYMPLSGKDVWPTYQSMLPLPTVDRLLENEMTVDMAAEEVAAGKQEEIHPNLQHQKEKSTSSEKPSNRQQSKSRAFKPIDERWSDLKKWYDLYGKN